jgi:HK97 family phage prohead protease
MSKRTDETEPHVNAARQTTKSATTPVQKVFGGTVENASTMPDMQVACIASTSAVDYMNDTIQAAGIEGRGNSVPICVNHDMDRVCGRAVWRYDSTLDGIRATITFADTPLGRETYGLIKSGVLTDVSVGIDALERKPRPGGGWDFTKSRLMEISVVTVGAHPAAVITQKAQKAAPLTKAERLRRANALLAIAPEPQRPVPLAVAVARQAQAHATAVQNLQGNDLRRREVRQARARALAKGGV